jgi:hypothetical protein
MCVDWWTRLDHVDLKTTRKVIVADRLIDYFPYFNERELLELRINLLKDHVDHFVISEADKTFSGLPRQFELKNLIAELGLPAEKITVIEVRQADDVDLQLELHDFEAQYPEDRADIVSIQAVARERIQRNALQKVLYKFDDTDWFLMSDIDEIINPNHIEFALNVARNNPDTVVKLPLINLYGRADLRPYARAGWPFVWRTAMSICKKSIVSQTTPHRIRCKYHVPAQIITPTIGGEIFDNFGWHFSWMGGDVRNQIKSRSYAHAPNQGHQRHRSHGFKFEEGESLSWEPESILKRFPVDQLPPVLFTLPRVREFLLPNFTTK